MRTVTSRNSNFYRTRLHERVIAKERRGDYLGATVQVIPHITDEIKHCIRMGAGDADVCMVEIGRHGRRHRVAAVPRSDPPDGCRARHNNVLYMHLTLIPYIPSSGRSRPSRRSTP